MLKKFIALKTRIKEKGKSQVNNISAYNNNSRNKEPNKHKTSQRRNNKEQKSKFKIKCKVINEKRSGSLGKMNKLDKCHLGGQNETQVVNIRN